MKKFTLFMVLVTSLAACKKQDLSQLTEKDKELAASLARGADPHERATFSLLSTIALAGGAGAAEISAFDAQTKKLFVVNNSSGVNQIDIYDLSDPANPTLSGNINTAQFGGFVNSVSVHGGKLAAAIEAVDKVSAGRILVFATGTYEVIANVVVGSLPDMVTFSPDGQYILSANEGEPNDAYTIDPVGSVSIINVAANYAVSTLDFSGFENRSTELKSKGFRIFGLNASFAQDIEPEYIAVAENSKKAWVTLQENNGIALIDLDAKKIVDVFPLGFKDYANPQNSIDPSDQDGGIFFNPWKVKGIYMPDGISVLANNNVPFVFTANEGDSREYSGFSEIKRISSNSVVLDPTAFPTAGQLKTPGMLGRLNITTTLGDSDQDGDLDELYSYGARSFSIWHGLTGELLYDSQDFIDKKAAELNIYPDGRSDDKGCEPEAITTGRVGNKNILFVGLERANAVMVFEMSNPMKPQFLQVLKTGTAPEGVLFVPAAESPNAKSTLIVSNETSGTVSIFTTN
ncbi:MAG: choice-of-anchor I family protein [Bacteroidota bacterium]